MTKKAVIIGCGGRAPAHIDAYQHIENAQVTACYAPSATRREPLAKKYGIKAYNSLEKMLIEEKPDIAHIITCPNTRVELLTKVSDYKVPLCTTEKPIACDVDDWKILCELEAKSSTKFAVCHQVRWQKDLVKCQKVATSGKLGKPLFLDISAGMNISGQGTHTLNYGRSIIGNPKVSKVFGSTHGWDEEDKAHPAPKMTECFLEFDNAVRGLWCSGDISPRCGRPDTTWQHVRIVAYFELGRINFEEFGKWEIVSPEGIESGHFGDMDVWAKKNVLAQSDFHKAMFYWLDDDTKIPGTNLKDSLHEWKTILALYKSSKEHRLINLKSDF